MKLLKMEVDNLPRASRKDALKQRKEEKEAEHLEKVATPLPHWGEGRLQFLLKNLSFHKVCFVSSEPILEI